MAEQRTEGLDADKKVVELPPVKRYELEDYEWREYEWIYDHDPEGNPLFRTKRIEKPVAFYWAPGHKNHRVVRSDGKVVIVPAVDVKGCVITYEKVAGAEPVTF